MNVFEKFLGGAVILIFVYLVIINYQGTTAALNGFAQMLTGVFGTLQGRAVSYGGSAGVTVR